MRQDGAVQIALVVYDGVLADECAAFRSVFERLPGAALVTVAAHDGVVVGPGGIQMVDATFDEVARPHVVAVPGGLGCERQAASSELREWLRRVAPTARWLLASSTGSIVLAAAGLLDGQTAVTHWLATDLLERYGVRHSEQRIAVTGKIVTSEGWVTARETAFTVVEEYAGAETAERIRHQLREHDVADVCPRRWYHRLRVDRAPRPTPPSPASDDTTRFDIDLVTERRERRRSHRRPRPPR